MGAVRSSSSHRRTAPPFAVVVVALALASTPAVAVAKSFSMPSVRIDAQVMRDGALTVTEVRTFDFSGDFTRVYWDIPLTSDVSVDVLGVTGKGGALRRTTAEGRPPGTYRVIQDPVGTPGVRIEAYGEYSNEKVPVTLRLRYRGAVKRYRDAAELYWQAIGPQWGEGVGDVTIVVRPQVSVDASRVLVWAHGPLTGSIHVGEGGVATAEVEDLPAFTFVEPRILYPPEVVPGAPLIDAARLEAVRAEEAANADTANAARENARRAVAIHEKEDAEFRMTSTWCGGAMAIAGVLAVGALFLAFGREHRAQFQGQYFREVPADLHPAVVSCLMNMGQVSDESISATLMDLSDRGVIRMEPVTEQDQGFLGIGAHEDRTYLLTLDQSRWSELSRLDQELLSFLFTTMAGDDTLSLDELKREAKSRPTEMRDGVVAFKAAVAEEADKLALFERSGNRARIGAWALVGLLCAPACLCAFASESIPLILIGIVSLIAAGTMAVLMTRRTPEANEMHAKYAALRNYLRDFSRLDEAPPASVILWNRFLVLAVVFGIAKEVIEQLRVRVPEVANDPAFAHSSWWVTSPGGFGSPIADLTSGIASAQSIASSELSSSSGGGGGFSGGGGGGFGGGGGGAD